MNLMNFIDNCNFFVQKFIVIEFYKQYLYSKVCVLFVLVRVVQYRYICILFYNVSEKMEYFFDVIK